MNRYDAVVIGAGIAGSVAAHRLSGDGHRVLLVDKATFPRDKVCGCCLNERSVQAFDEAGLGAALRKLGPVGLTGVRLIGARREAALRLPGGLALSRSALDAALIQAAKQTGAEVRTGVSARVVSTEPSAAKRERLIALRRPGSHEKDETDELVAADLVIVADGLAGRSLTELESASALQVKVRPSARIGVSTRLRWSEPVERSERSTGSGFDSLTRGTIHMAVPRSAGGYVGMVILEDGTLDLAAALDVALVKQCGGPAAAVQARLEAVGWHDAEVNRALHAARWYGAPALTRHRKRLAAERLLIAGDAAGYVEPFTGEGMAWAVAGGRAAAELAHEALTSSVTMSQIESLWAQRHRRAVRRRQMACRGVTALLRHPRLANQVIHTLHRFPQLATPVTAHLNQPMRRHNLSTSSAPTPGAV